MAATIYLDAANGTLVTDSYADVVALVEKGGVFEVSRYSPAVTIAIVADHVTKVEPG